MSGVGLYLLQADPFRILGDLFDSPLLWYGLWVVVALFAVLWLSLAYWTGADAGRRGISRFLWGAVALIFPFVGTLVYLMVRPPEYLLDQRERELELEVLERELMQRADLCFNCRSAVEKDYLLCPECGWDLKKPCKSCQRPLRLSWGICPYCTAEQQAKKIDW